MITLNDKRIPDFVKVNSVDFSILPPIQNNLLTVRGKAGAYHMSQDVGTRVFTVGISIIAEEINGVMSASRELASWLNHKEAVKLVFDDEPDKYYMAVPDGETSLTETVNVGQGTISFLCTEPYAFGATKQLEYSPVTGNEIVYVDYGGTAESSPEISLTMREDVTSIVIADDERFVMVGDGASVEETPKDTNPIVLWDEMIDTQGWTTAIAIDKGVIQGEFESDGFKFFQKDNDYGTGNQWHGASAIKSLPKPIQDFDIEVDFEFESNLHQLGQIEIYLLDENNTRFGKMRVADAWTGIDKKAWHVEVADTRHVYETRNGGVWNYFRHGKLRIQRTGNDWFAWIGKWNRPINEYRSRLSKYFTNDSKYASPKLAKIQIHLGVNSTYEAPHLMTIRDIKVNERLTLGSNDVPIIAKKDDVLKIDNAKGILYKNGVPFYEGLNPSSRFLKLQEGLNGIAVTPAKADVSITYPERWL